MVTASVVRRVVTGVCMAAIVGMIVSSVQDNNGAALAFGLAAAAAVGCLIVATAVAPGPRPATSEEEAARVEGLVHDVVNRGADEAEVRALVAAAVRLGRSQAGDDGRR